MMAAQVLLRTSARLRSIGGRGFGTLLAAAVMFLGFSLVANRFATLPNIINLAKQMSIVGVLGVGMTMVVLVGGIDLSVGSIVLLSGAVAGPLLLDGFGAAAAIPAAILTGTAVGVANGWLVERLRISPVIVTLGTMIAVRGLGLVLLERYRSWIDVDDPVFDALGSGSIFGFPATALVLITVASLCAILLRTTTIGRRMYAIGDNAAAARLCGVDVARVRSFAYLVSGTLAGVAGVLSMVRTAVVSPSIGVGLEFSAVTVVVLGGAKLTGGAGSVEETIVGAAILVMVLNFLTINGVPGTWQTTVTGGLILLAVLLKRGLGQGAS
jgi:ribose transport system permease protein